MAIGSVISSGLQGVQAGIQQTGRATSRIAGSVGGADSADLAVSLVGLKTGEIQVKASASVIKTGDELLGTLIDIRA